MKMSFTTHCKSTFAFMVAEAVREGLTFEASDNGNGEYTINYTGGF